MCPERRCCDCAYGENTELRERLDAGGREYVLGASAQTSVFSPETNFQVPERTGKRGRPKSRPRPDRKPESIGALIAGLGADALETVTFRDGPSLLQHRSQRVHHQTLDLPPAFVFTTSGFGMNTLRVGLSGH